MDKGTKERRNRTRELLKRWGSTTDDIQRLERDREAYRQWALDARYTLGASRLDGLPRSGQMHDLGDVVLSVEKRAQMYEDQSQRIDGEIAKCLRIRNAVEELVCQLPEIKRRVIMSRYIDRRQWRNIAFYLTYDEGHVRRIETQAVDWIGEQLEKDKIISEII